VTATATRVPQPERTRATRRRLLEATVACLAEHGWSGTSTTLVSRRAGVSRGAQLHHFPSRRELVLAVVEHLATVRVEEVGARLGALPRDGRRTRAVVEAVAELFTGPTSSAALELAVAARADPELSRAVAGLEARVGRAVSRHAAEALGVDESVPGVGELVEATLQLARGMGLVTTATGDAVRRSGVLDAWAAALDAQLAARAAQS
jgi:AcrR family transcriptional regulator